MQRKKGDSNLVTMTPATNPPRMPATPAEVVQMRPSARLQMRGADGELVSDLTLTCTEGAACLIFVARQRGVKLTPEQRAELMEAARQHNQQGSGKP
jgi:hypothetical protein